MTLSRATALALTVALAGCNVFGDGDLSGLTRNHERWRQADIHNYDFDYEVIAFAIQPPVRIEVRNDLVTRVVNRSSGAELSTDGFPTIDSLFVWTERLTNTDYKLRMTFDPQYHFPSRVDGDIPNAVDDEFTRLAGNLQVR